MWMRFDASAVRLGGAMFFRRAIFVLACSALALLSTAPAVLAASSVECGMATSYTAPDPAAPADGSLTIGLLPAWTVKADATVSADVAANLAGLVNNGPVCLAVDTDADGAITSLAFAPGGDIVGHVGLDGGTGFYTFADRLFIPGQILTQYPGLGALFLNAYTTGGTVSATFTTDQASGAFTGVDARATFCGAVSRATSGDGRVGKATIDASLLSAANRRAFAAAHGRHGCAAIRSIGAPSQSGVDLQTTVSLTVDAAASPRPTVPPTSTTESRPTRAGTSLLALLGFLGVGSIASVALTRRMRRLGRRLA
jgi:hypothetical protein